MNKCDPGGGSTREGWFWCQGVPAQDPVPWKKESVARSIPGIADAGKNAVMKVVIGAGRMNGTVGARERDGAPETGMEEPMGQRSREQGGGEGDMGDTGADSDPTCTL